MLDARAQVGEVVHGSAAEESGRVKLGADRVDLGGSDILGGRVELEVNPQVGAASVEEVSRKHDSTGLRSGGGQLALLGSEEVLADRLGLREAVALIVGANLKGSILRNRRKNLDHVEGIQRRRASLLTVGLGSNGTDTVLDVGHVGGLIVALPEAHSGRELEVVVPDTLMLNSVVASTESELVGNHKVERDCVCVASLKNMVLREVCRVERHTKLHERTRSIVGTGVLAEEVNTSVASADEEDVKAIICNISLGVDDDVSSDLGARSV
ncbi:hypothetical protein HG531_003321 [Fusarium graminearum]|nr:hypothetical protein HG531_003321 [Fusarium graminearum]